MILQNKNSYHNVFLIIIRNSNFVEALNIPKSEGVGIKLEDIGELLSAACSCLEDELEMQELASEVVQVCEIMKILFKYYLIYPNIS